MILVLSGTHDGREVVENLLNEGYKIIMTTATDLGASLMKAHDRLEVIVGRLNESQMMNLILEKKIFLIIDATHPYAVEVSNNAMSACENTDIYYLRFQRRPGNIEHYFNNIIRAEGYEDAAMKLKQMDGNILLTTGSKSLEIFAGIIEANRLFPRVLPTSDSLRKCEKLGFSNSNIIAMQGPFSQEMNEEIIKRYSIKILVTKESGDGGGIHCKLKAAQKMNIPVLIIDRPEQKFTNIVDDTYELIWKVREVYGRILSNNA